MKTNLPIHMDAWQDFKHSWLGVATITAVLAIIILTKIDNRLQILLQLWSN